MAIHYTNTDVVVVLGMFAKTSFIIFLIVLVAVASSFVSATLFISFLSYRYLLSKKKCHEKVGNVSKTLQLIRGQINMLHIVYFRVQHYV